MRAGKADPMTFLLSGFLMVGGFFLLSFSIGLLEPRWQPLFGIPAILFILVGALTYIRELMVLWKEVHLIPDSLQGGT